MKFHQPGCRITAIIAAIYVFWIGISVIVHEAGNRLTAEGFFSGGIIVLTVFLHVCLAAFATVFFMLYAMETLRMRHGMRSGFIGLCVLITAMLFLYSRQAQPDGSGIRPILSMLNTVNLIVFANLIGSWITIPLKRPAELAPVCVVMVLADLFSVLRGPSREIVESLTDYYETGMAGPPPMADFLLVKITVPGAAHLMPVFGVSDWIIIAFFSAAAFKFGYNDNIAGKAVVDMHARKRPSFYLPVSVLGLFAAVAMAHALDIFLPALPLVALCFMLYTLARYPDARKLEHSDWLASAGAVIIMCGLMAIYGFLWP